MSYEIPRVLPLTYYTPTSYDLSIIPYTLIDFNYPTSISWSPVLVVYEYCYSTTMGAEIPIEEIRFPMAIPNGRLE